LFEYKKTNFSTTKSLQSNWIRDQLSTLKETASVREVFKNLAQPFIEEDMVRFVADVTSSRVFLDMNHRDQIQLFSYWRIPAAIDQERLIETEQSDIARFFFGPDLEKKRKYYLPFNHPNYSTSITQEQYNALRELEENDPLNERGLFEFSWLLDHKPRVPRLTHTTQQCVDMGMGDAN